MPFYGIVVKIYFGDHFPPHFHAEYGANEALIDIDKLSVIAGELPLRAAGLVMEWASMHREELLAAWDRATQLQTPGKIAPLP